jgi:hypothetical protein
MKSVSECERRAQDCMRKAEVAVSAADRAGWMQLAEDWTTMSKVPFRMASEISAAEPERPQSRIGRTGWLKRLLRG